MIIEDNNGLIRLLAEDNCKITNKDRTFFVDFIYLGKNDAPSNYDEVGKEIWKHFVEDRLTIDELTEEVETLKDEKFILENNQINIEECLLDSDFRLLVLEIHLGIIE